MTVPPATGAAPVRRAITALLGTAASLLLLGIGAPPAAAHDGLVSSSPAAEDALASGPASVDLTFSAEPLPLGTEVLVAGPDGGTVSDGPAEIRGTTVVQPLSDGLPAGGYTVNWRSTSSDGHPLSGGFGFTVTEGSAAAPSPAAVEAAGAGSDAGAGSGFPAWPVAGAALLAGVAVLALRRVRRAA
ncbi:copper resistance CopC family protein [Blastococcus sp. LR1]|uniref:copper resistance CopC family protein n=1 Tax=Blastococcus sp. LR1 TaxID=2877000 RepID=UPI001CCC0300|nr:copper resistance CopC family protein [Blastococcus sp. LR1]MCA0145517.1 copper resistance protein CopC [Blastococcus sp. LR1]